MKIDIICNDGSPLGVTEKTLRGEDGRLGVGGAEYALLTMCAAWQFYGNQVRLYNDPKEFGVSTFAQQNVADFHPDEDRDILIIFRSPNVRSLNAKGFKVWWSCDSYTVDDFPKFAQTVQKIVTISPYHSQYFREHYGIQNTIPIDLPVRVWEYNGGVEKNMKQCLFSSMPDRGLMQLHAVWPQIVSLVPNAHLVITSDWRLWADWATEDQTREYRLSYLHHPNVTYLGAVKRENLVRIQQQSALHVYPSIFEEMFCIAVAESQVAGCFPVTNDKAALATTNMGAKIYGNADDPTWREVFVAKVVELLSDEEGLRKKQEWVQNVARSRFSIEKILAQWDAKVFAHG